MIINIRGTSGSGKSTLVKRFLDEHPFEEIKYQFSTWKVPRTVAYKCQMPDGSLTYVIGRYETQCGGCDSMSYKGSHDDIEQMVRFGLEKGHVIFEGLTISSTLTRWMRISQENPGKFVWAFMNTDVEVCHQRILGRSGREPKRDAKGLADYQKKYNGCMKHIVALREQGELVIELSSDEAGYQQMLGVFTDATQP